MSRRFTLTDLLFWVTFVALVLALIVPLGRAIVRVANVGDIVVAVAASADGSTFGALLGNGKVLIWDRSARLKSTLQAKRRPPGRLALSFDGRFAVVAPAVPGGFALRGVEVFDVASGKLLKAIPSTAEDIAFSPVENLLAITDGDTTEIHTLDDDSPVNTIAEGGTCVKFSPDGRRLAIANGPGQDGVLIYDTTGQELERHLDVPDNSVSWHYVDMAWSPDGQKLAGLCLFADDGMETLQTWHVTSGDMQNTTLPADDSCEALTYLPSGRHLALAGVRSGMTLLDATTLKRLPAPATPGVYHLAAGLRGNSFLVAGTTTVELWDATTLKPQRRLLEASPEPNVIPALFGLIAWMIWFGFRRARRLVRPCQTCGQKFQPIGPKDVSVDCLTCRRKAEARQLTLNEMARRQRKSARNGAAILLAFDACVAAGIALALRERLGFWLPFVFVGVGLPAAFIGIIVARSLWNLRAAASTTNDAEFANEAAGAQGTVREVGTLVVWSAPGTSLGELLHAEIEVARERLALALGRSVPAPACRALVFADSDMLGRYLKKLRVQFAPRLLRKSFYWRAPGRRLLIAERGLREAAPEPRVTLRSLVIYQLLEAIDGRAPAAWIEQGLVGALSHDDEFHELARLNRRVMAGCAAGRTISAAEFFTSTAGHNWKKHGRHGELEHFARTNQFAAQAWSVMEFLCGRGATPERRLAFQQFFNDADRPKRPVAAIERHFACSMDEILASWQTWVETQGIGGHLPPPHHVAEFLLKGPIAKAASPDTPPGERQAAMRELGESGYLLGADVLIALLHQDNDEIHAEAVWALECISGRVLGLSPAAWEDWWAGVAAEAAARA